MASQLRGLLLVFGTAISSLIPLMSTTFCSVGFVSAAQRLLKCEAHVRCATHFTVVSVPGNSTQGATEGPFWIRNW